MSLEKKKKSGTDILAHGLDVREVNDSGMKARFGSKQSSEWW